MGNNGTWDGLSEGTDCHFGAHEHGFLGVASQGGRGSCEPQKDLEEVGGVLRARLWLTWSSETSLSR